MLPVYQYTIYTIHYTQLQLIYNQIIQPNLKQAPNEVPMSQPSRVFLKNDLFYFPSKLTYKGQAKKKEEEIANQIKNADLEGPKQYSNKQELQAIDFLKSYTFQVQNQQKSQLDIDDELKRIIREKKQCKKTREKDTPQKSIFFKPRNTLKLESMKIEQQKQKKDEREQFVIDRRQKWEMWKLRNDFAKVMNVQHTEKQPEQQDDEKDIKGTSETKNGIQKEQNDGIAAKDEGKKEGQKKNKTTGKKKIKKQVNLVKTDLKRKYRDRFVGGVNKSLRMLTKGGKMKKMFRKDNLHTEFQSFQTGDLYNSYTISLSKALFLTVDLDENQGQIIDKHKLAYTVPDTYERPRLEQLIQELFGFSTFRQGQYQTIINILNGKSTLFVSETASGKSLTYLLTSVILKGLSIIVSPLVSLMLDQIDHLPNDIPAACISSLLNHQQKDRIITMVKSGKIQLLYITPQSFLTDFMYHVREFPPINFVCVDEAHSMSELSHSFRASYLSLQDIILKNFVYKKSHPVILCLTATANVETVQSIKEKLKIKQVIKSNSIINKNLFCTISREYLSGKYEGILKYLSFKQIRRCKGILVYCRTKKIMYEVFNYLRNSGLLCYIYHSGLTQRQKVQTIEKFRRGQIRVVIATVALGMGLDFESLQCVIHINMPKSVENYIQEIGRAGRRQKRAYCHLFLDKYDYFTERNYFLADELEPQIFKTIIEILKTDFLSKRKGKKKLPNKSNNSQSLKRVNFEQNEKQRHSQDEGQNDSIYEEQEDQKQGDIEIKNVQNRQAVIQKESPEKERIADLSKNQNNQILSKKSEQEVEQQQVQDIQTQLQFKSLSYCRSELITEKSGLKQQAILNVLLKIQKNLTPSVFKVYPMSFETLKISFFRKNQQNIKQQSQFYRKLIENTKTVKGTVYIPLILKCNELKMAPIRLVSDVYGLSNKYCLKIQLSNQVFVWQHKKSSEETFSKLEKKQMFKKIMSEFNLVQKTALTKFNIFYSLCFKNSAKIIDHIIEKGQIISENTQLPQDTILSSFDQYFKEETYKFYHDIADEAEGVETIEQSHKEMFREAGYLPITSISEEDRGHIQQSVQVFIRNLIVNNIDKPFIQTITPYRDGRLITRIFLGVNDNKTSWKIYGEHPYWMKYVDKDYRELLKEVRKQINQFIIREGPLLLSMQKKQKQFNSKK